MTAIKQPRLLLIDWVDACDYPGWCDESNLEKQPIRCQTIGFLVRQDKQSITLALNRSCDSGFKPFGNMIIIPVGCIKKKKQLR